MKNTLSKTTIRQQIAAKPLRTSFASNCFSPPEFFKIQRVFNPYCFEIFVWHLSILAKIWNPNFKFGLILKKYNLFLALSEMTPN